MTSQSFSMRVKSFLYLSSPSAGKKYKPKSSALLTLLGKGKENL